MARFYWGFDGIRGRLKPSKSCFEYTEMPETDSVRALG